MTRKKISLRYITDSSKRKATFKKRINGVMNKIDQLSILCGIEAFAIIYVPENPQPNIWPSENGVKSVLSRFKAMPKPEQRQKIFNQETFQRVRITEAEEKLKNLKNENRKTETKLHMSQYFFNAGKNLDDANLIDLNDISNLASTTNK